MPPKPDLISNDETSRSQTITVSIVLSLILIAGVTIIWRFIPSVILALIFAVSAWSMFVWLRTHLTGRRTLAASIMTLLLVIGFVLPAYVLSNSLVSNFSEYGKATIAFLKDTPPSPSLWMHQLPYLSSYADRLWSDYVADSDYIVEAIKADLDTISQLVLRMGTAVGTGVADLALAIFISFFCFRDGESLLRATNILLEKYLGSRMRYLLEVSRRTTIGIVYGLLGTAVVQAVLAGAGYAVAGVPGAVFLGLITFLISPLPVGAPAIWIPVSVWLLSQHKLGMALFVFFWGLLVVSAIDNIIRPYLISKGSRMPLLVVFLGALGGVLTFGFTGFFIGPTILALIYVLIREDVLANRAVVIGAMT